MGLEEHKTSVDAIRYLAGYTSTIVEAVSKLSVSYNINVVIGSMPVVDETDDELYNIAYMCKRNGQIEEQRKLHPNAAREKSVDYAGW